MSTITLYLWIHINFTLVGCSGQCADPISIIKPGSYLAHHQNARCTALVKNTKHLIHHNSSCFLHFYVCSIYINGS